MSKNKKAKDTNTNSKSSWLNVFKDARLGFLVGVIILFLTFYVAVASVSYFITGASDQSLIGKYEILTEQIVEKDAKIKVLQKSYKDNETAANKEALTTAQKERKALIKERQKMCDSVKNMAGYRGAVIAETLMNRAFGISAFFLLVFPAVVGLRLIGVKLISLPKAFIYSVIFAVWGSLLMGYLFYHLIPLKSSLSMGGDHGIEITNWLINNIGKLGTGLVLLGTGIIFVVCAFSSAMPKMQGWLLRKKEDNNVEDNGVVDNGLDDNNGAENDGDGLGGDNNGSGRTLDDEVPTTNVINVSTDGLLTPQTDHTNTNNENTTAGSDNKDSETLIDDAADNENNTDDNDNKTHSTIIDIVPAEDNDDTEHTEGQNQIDNQGDIIVTSVDNSQNTDGVIEEIGTTPLNPIEEKIYDKLAELGPYDPRKDLPNYRFPTLDLLKEYTTGAHMTDEEKKANQTKIIETFRKFNIGIKQIYETTGPTVTLYEIVPEDGVRVATIRRFEDDIMMSLSAKGIRIIAPMPGKGTIGIEVPNPNPQTVSMRATLASKKFQESTFELPIAIGRTITNEVFTFDLCKMPHLLVAGATGQGKSVGLNAIITSLLYKKHPAELKFILVDPKKVEFNIYSEIEKHYLAKLPDAEEPVITDTDKVKQTLNSVCKEMDDRYLLLKDAKVRNIKEYNEKFKERRLNPEKGHRFLPYIVVIVDEFGDLIMTAGKEIENPIARIAQLARAVGIHMVIATQRPAVNIITGNIKANFPARIAFRVMQSNDSKTILDQSGAHRLIGKGDMLFTNGNELTRIQCAFVDTPEVEKIVQYISHQTGYTDAMMLPECELADNEDMGVNDIGTVKLDALFGECARDALSAGFLSTSAIQRRYSIGFNRAGRIVDQLASAGILGPANGSKPRQTLIQTSYELEQILQSLGV